MESTEVEYEDMGLWSGSKASAIEFSRLKDLYSEKMIAGLSDMSLPDDSDPAHDTLLTYAGSVAILDVNGILAPGEYCRHCNYGIVGYDDIRRAALAALSSGVSHLVVKLDTPGGVVSGLGACSVFLKELSSSMNISFYCDGTCASAGTWLATSVGKMIVGAYASVGNVGIMRRLMDATKFNQNLGVTYELLTSTELKGAGDPNIKLTKDQRAYLQEDVDKWGSLFVQHLATSLDLPEDYVRTNIAIAKDWIGQELVTIGLASKVMSFDKFVAEIQKKAQNTRNSQSPTPSQRFAMSTPIIPEATEDSDLLAALTAETVEPEVVADPPVQAAPSLADTSLAAFATQIAVMASENAELKLKLAAAEADKSALALQIDAAKPILRETAQGFSVRLGKAAVGLDSSDVPTLVAMITDLRTEFKKVMPVGQQSVASSAVEDDAEVDTLTAELTSRSIAASMPRKKK